MKTAAISIGLVLLAAEARPAPQDTAAPLASAPITGQEAPRSGDGQAGGAATGERTPAEWRRALAGADLAARLEAYDRMVARALEDPATRQLVEGWASQEGELGWTARLALRELELRDDAASRPSGNRPLAGTPFRGQRAPLGRGFGGGPFGGWDPFGGRDPFGFSFGDPFGGDLMRDMEERLGALLDRQGAPGANGQVQGSAESFRMESGPDGVRVEVLEQDADGNTQKKTYEADSLEELLQLHPELKARLRTGALRPGPDPDVRDLYDRLRERRGVLPFGAQRIPTDKLGILMREPGSFTSSAPGLDADTGLYVERVFPGTLASELGIRPGDVLTRLDGRALKSAADVQAALAAREPGDRLTAEVVDPRGERRELSWRAPERDLRQL